MGPSPQQDHEGPSTGAHMPLMWTSALKGWAHLCQLPVWPEEEAGECRAEPPPRPATVAGKPRWGSAQVWASPGGGLCFQGPLLLRLSRGVSVLSRQGLRDDSQRGQALCQPANTRLQCVEAPSELASKSRGQGSAVEPQLELSLLAFTPYHLTSAPLLPGGCASSREPLGSLKFFGVGDRGYTYKPLSADIPTVS